MEDLYNGEIAVSVLSMLSLTLAAVLIRDRIPIRLYELAAMNVSDYLVLINHLVTWQFCFAIGMLVQGVTRSKSCKVIAFQCLSTLALAKLLSVLLMLEKLHYIAHSARRISRRRDIEYVITSVLTFGGLGVVIVWVFVTFDGRDYDGHCRVEWGATRITLALCVLALCDLYLTLRCAYLLIRTHNPVMTSWAYRLIGGFMVCFVATVGNIGSMVGHGKFMPLNLCLIACLVDTSCTNAAMHYLIVYKPNYKAIVELPGEPEFNNLAVTRVDIPAVRNPSLASKAAAPSYRTRLTGENMSARATSIFEKRRTSCVLVSGATSEGISEYLSQVSQVSSYNLPVLLARPRHVSFLPSHPLHESHAMPRPIYSCYPNYSVEDVPYETLEVIEGEKSPQTLSSCSSMTKEDVLRGQLYACDQESVTESNGSLC